MINKVAIIGTVGLPAKYGGFETLVEHLSRHMKHEVLVYCSGRAYDQRLQTYNGATLKYINLNANGIQSIPYDIFSITHACRYADTLLILGVSGCIVLPILKMISSKKIIVNIDGLEWKREKWNKYAKWFLKLSEKRAVQYADTVITDNKVIQDYVKSEYGVKSELIAYGADHVEKVQIDLCLLDKYPFLSKNYAFIVCRIEPENNIHIIIESVSQLEKIPLIIVGNWNASNYGKNLKRRYSKCNHVHLLDPIYDQKKLNMIRSNCYIYLHGHSAGGTNPSLVEAMYLGLPIIAWGVRYNKETTRNKALYFNDINELKVLLQGVTGDELEIIASSMSDIAKEEYNWKSISDKYNALF